MRKHALSRDERKLQIIQWYAIRVQHNNDTYASVYEIARGLGLSPSTKLRKIVQELVDEMKLEQRKIARSGRWQGTGFRLKRGTFLAPRRIAPKIKLKAKGIEQGELL